MKFSTRTLGLTGGQTLYRPIDFERYRKPQVVEYPRNAIVLNPHHTRQQMHQQQQQQQQRQYSTNAGDGSGRDSANSEDDEDDGDNSDDDDDDPRRLPSSSYLCSDESLAGLMHLTWREVGPAGVGLDNLGNTCFANSVLQAISYTPALAQYLASTFRAADTSIGAPYDFAFALAQVVRQTHLQPGRGAYRPTPVISHMSQLSKHFRLGRQCDAHEFAVQLLSACQKSILFRRVGPKKVQPRVAHTTALNRICGGYLRSQVAWSRRDEMNQLRRAGKKQAAHDLAIEAEQLAGRSAADADKLVSNTYDPTTVIAVEIVGHTLESCLQHFCSAERLDGRCYLSPRGVGVVATKQFSIHVPPPVLILQLKRFAPTGGKASKVIRYPQRLDLRPFCTQAAVGAEAQQQPMWYELNALVVHHGRALNSGHYTAFVRSRNGAWLHCDDSRVSPVSEDRALGQEAYMLYYSSVPRDGKSTAGGKSTHTPRQTHGGGVPSLSASPGQRSPAGRLTALPRLPGAADTRSSIMPSGAFGQDLGRELDENELRASLAAQRRESSDARKTALPVVHRGGGGGGNNISKEALKRQREDLETESSEDEVDAMRGFAAGRARHTLPLPGGDDDIGLLYGDGDNPTGPKLRRTEEPLASTVPAPGRPFAVLDTESGERRERLKRSPYAGIVRNVRHSRRQELAGHASAGLGSAPTPVGRQALETIERGTAEATPVTLRRPERAPKFQQRSRDALWENEMDRGRLKKVKTKRQWDSSTHAGNAFQKIADAKRQSSAHE